MQSLGGAGAIALTVLLISPAASAEQRRNDQSSASTIKRALAANPKAIGLTTAQLRNYSSFKAALSPLIIETHKARVRTTDSGFIDAVLKPVYNNLLIRRVEQDQRFSNQAKLTSAVARVGTLPSGEVLLYQQVEFTPRRVLSCDDQTRSGNLLCIQGKKQFA